MKLAVVGGGSTYTPELLDGIARLREDLSIEEIWLVDPHAERREVVAAFGRRMLAKADHPASIHTTDDVAAAAADAQAVVFQLRVGGQQARHGDETFPHREGCIGQETTGPGGFAKALRTVPVMLEAAEVASRVAASDAWLIDFTNPVGIVTRALLEAGHRAIGLCNVALGFQRRYAAHFQVDPSAVRLDHVGLNHLTWERAVYVTRDGQERDVLPDLLDNDLEATAATVHMAPDLLRLVRAIPSYYLRYFYAHDEVYREQVFAPSRAQEVAETELELMAYYNDPAHDTKPAALDKRGGAYYSEAAIGLLASLTSDRGDRQVLNVRNNGTFAFLPDDHVIEVPVEVHADGPRAVPIAPLSSDLEGLVAHVAAYERLALEAALHGGRDRVIRALLAHPLVGQFDKAERLADGLIAHNASYLPWAR